MKSFALVSLLLSACAHDSGGAGGSGGPQNVPAGKYALQLKLNPGEVRKYQVEVQVHTKALMNDAPVFDAPMTMKFTQVLETGQKGADGATELKERIENLDFSAEGPFGDQIKPMMAGLTKVVIISNIRPDGTIASTKTEGADNPMVQGMAKQMAQGARFTFLPKTPVGPGDTWTTEEKSPLGGMGNDKVQATVKSTLKFVGVEACGDKQCAHVESDSVTSVPEDSAEVSGGGKGHSTLMIEVDSGRPWKSHGEQNSKFQTQQGGQPFDIQSDVKYSSELKP
jgi:hypothetical protein